MELEVEFLMISEKFGFVFVMIVSTNFKSRMMIYSVEQIYSLKKKKQFDQKRYAIVRARDSLFSQSGRLRL